MYNSIDVYDLQALLIPQNVLRYAYSVLGGVAVGQSLENIILTDPLCILEYSANVLEGPWHLGAQTLLTTGDPNLLKEYLQRVDPTPWPEAERVLALNPHTSLFYAKDILKGRFLRAEELILRAPIEGSKYCQAILLERNDTYERNVTTRSLGEYEILEVLNYCIHFGISDEGEVIDHLLDTYPFNGFIRDFCKTELIHNPRVLESMILDPPTNRSLYDYIERIYSSNTEELEKIKHSIISAGKLTDPYTLVELAKLTPNERWAAAEKYIMRDPLERARYLTHLHE